MTRFFLGVALAGLLVSCGSPPPPRSEAKRLNVCGDLPPQPAQLADDERVVRAEVRNDASSNLELTGVCLSHRQRRVDPVSADVKLGDLHDRPMIFELHTPKSATHFRLHFHATATRTVTRKVSAGGEHKSNLDLDVYYDDIPDNTVRLTIDVNDSHALVTKSVPAPRP